MKVIVIQMTITSKVLIVIIVRIKIMTVIRKIILKKQLKVKMIEIIRTILLVRIMRIIILRATIITNITQGQTNSERETLFGLIRPTLKA